MVVYDQSDCVAFQIESARDAISCGFMFQRSLTPLDLNICEYMLMRRSVFTEERYWNMCQPRRRILYTLHLDLPRDMERSLRNSAPEEWNQCNSFQFSDYLDIGDFAYIIVNDIMLASNKTQKLRRYMKVMKLLNLHRHRLTANFIFDSIIQVLYPKCMDSKLVVEFAETFSFYSWIYYRESPVIVGYVLEHACRIRYNIWASLEWRLDPINACIRFSKTGNIGKLLEYGTSFTFECNIYQEILEFVGARNVHRRISERRIFLLIQLFYFFTYNRSSWEELRRIWRSIPDPYLNGKEIYFTFSRDVASTCHCHLIEYYNSKIVEENAQMQYVAPRSLRHLSRVAVRNILSSNFQLPYGISQLGICPILERIICPISARALQNLERILDVHFIYYNLIGEYKLQFYNCDQEKGFKITPEHKCGTI